MEQQQQVPTQTPSKQQIMLMTERFAQEYIHIYNNLKNKYKIKFIKNQNFHADCIVNNMPFLFVLNDSPNIDNRINLFIKSFASRHVILFNNNWNLYEKLIVSNIENNNRNIQMYYSEILSKISKILLCPSQSLNHKIKYQKSQRTSIQS